MSSTTDNSIDDAENISNQVPILEQNNVDEVDPNFVTPTRPTTHVEPNAPIPNDRTNEMVEQQTNEEPIQTPIIQRIPFNLEVDQNISNNEDQDIHYCGNRDCEGDCGVLVCGCIDTCRNRCGTRSYSF